ncbi:MAG: DUF6263 family protein [Planctomycetales bacterium]
MLRLVRGLLCLAPLCVAGCGWEDEAEEAEVPALEAATTAPPKAPLLEEERLELKLAPGDRFPLMKTVEQTITQGRGAEGSESRSLLEMLLAITVEDVQPDGRKLLGVRYQRVRYVQDVAGERVEFDSAAPPHSVPLAAEPYRRLVDNGFSFWLGADNRVRDLVGFDEFLRRCVQDVPIAQRADVLARFSRTTSEEGIANFIDDSIGILPYASERGERASVVREGSTWSREQRFEQPLPVYLRTDYTLRRLTGEVAHVDVLGTIGPSTTYRPTQEAADGVRIRIRNGHSFGSCTIRRDTGLPVESRIERLFDMTVLVPGGGEFEQQKRIVTTIRTFPQQAQATAAATGGEEAEIRR